MKRLGAALQNSIRKSMVAEKVIIEGAFLVTNHGILVAKSEGYRHSDVVMSMLSAVENFVADSLAILMTDSRRIESVCETPLDIHEERQEDSSGQVCPKSLDPSGLREKERHKQPLNKLKCGEHTIIIEKGRIVNLVLLVRGSETELLLRTMRELLYKIHVRFGQLLVEWDGEWGKTKDIEKMIQAAVQDWNRVAK